MLQTLMSDVDSTHAVCAPIRYLFAKIYNDFYS